MLALLGRGYVYLLLFTAVLIVIRALQLLVSGESLIGALFFGGFAAFFGWSVIRSLFRPLPEPHGVTLNPNEVPELFVAIAEVRAQLNAPAVHRVVIDREFNVSVEQRLRWGFVGPAINTLRVGLPVLGQLPPEAFRAVLGHELGHLSGGHNRLGARVYGLLDTWMALAGRSSQLGDLIVAPFVNWYVPYFGDVSFVMRRAQEVDADRCEVQVGGLDLFVDTMLRWEVVTAWLGEEWTEALVNRATTLPEPPDGIWAELLDPQPAAYEPRARARRIKAALARETDLSDSHPCPRERLERAGATDPQRWTPPEPPARSAARAFLGSYADVVVGRLDAEWRERNRPRWTERHQASLQERAELERLRRLQRRAVLSEPQRITLGLLAAEHGDPDEAIGYLRAALDLDRTARVPLALARLLARRGDLEADEALESAMTRDPDTMIEASRIGHDSAMLRGDEERARWWLERGQAYVELMEDAAAERSGFEPSDLLVGDALSGPALRTLVDALSRGDEVLEAWLVRKPTTLLRHRPYLLLMVRPARLGNPLSSDPYRELRLRLQATELGFPADLVVWVLSGTLDDMEIAVRRVPGGQILGEEHASP